MEFHKSMLLSLYWTYTNYLKFCYLNAGCWRRTFWWNESALVRSYSHLQHHRALYESAAHNRPSLYRPLHTSKSRIASKLTQRKDVFRKVLSSGFTNASSKLRLTLCNFDFLQTNKMLWIHLTCTSQPLIFSIRHPVFTSPVKFLWNSLKCLLRLS